nr:ABC transporter permease [Corynebacterium stercoris]
MAASSLNTNRLRSLLTLLGIIIGIMAVIIIMTLGRGLENDVMSDLEGVGTTSHPVYIHARPDEADQDDDPFAALYYDEPSSERDGMTIEQLEQLQAYFGDRVQAVDIAVSGSGDVAYGDTTSSSSIDAVLPGSLKVRGREVEFGRAISEADLSGQRPVAVVSQEFVQALFGGDPSAALGERFDVDLGGQPAAFTVVGVLKPHTAGGQMFGAQDYAEIFIPATSADRVNLQADWVTSFTVQAAATEETSAFQADLQAYLDRVYAGNEDFEAEVMDLSSALEGLSKTFGIMSTVLSAIGGISLLVGGIGVMNIMLITVTERTREIGVRKALGATQGDIRMQFIIEAMLVCLLGGVIGVILGGAIGMVATSLAFTQMAWPPIGAVIFALLFSLATGVFFGYYPASKAAKMQPIDALRYE